MEASASSNGGAGGTHARVAIVGAGFSGIGMAARLLAMSGMLVSAAALATTLPTWVEPVNNR